MLGGCREQFNAETCKTLETKLTQKKEEEVQPRGRVRQNTKRDIKAKQEILVFTAALSTEDQKTLAELVSLPASM